MIVMMANNTGIRIGYMAGRFPGRVGHLFGPSGWRPPVEFMPYALDNDRFAKGSNWSEVSWLKMLNRTKLCEQKPRWLIVPDVVGDRESTLSEWRKYFPIAKDYGWPLAFAVQDGMTARDVPVDATVVFIGGSTAWKWTTVRSWCRDFPRVHVGRVNEYRRLWECEDYGAESCDGTGLGMRGDQRQLRGVMAYFEESCGLKPRTVQLKLA